MDESTTLPVYDQLVEQIYDAHNINVSRTKIELMLLYYGGILATSCNVRYINPESKKEEIPNIYSMIFAPSSSGKDFLKNRVHEYFEPYFKNLPTAINLMIEKNITKGLSELQEEYKDKRVADYEYSLVGSRQGIYMLSTLVQEANLGSLNIAINEFGDILKQHNNLNLLKELYDGVMMASIIQGDKNDDVRGNIYGIPTNTIIYGTPITIKQDTARMKEFKQIVQTGLYRRSLIYYEPVRELIKKEAIFHDIADIREAYRNLFFELAFDKDKDFIKKPVVLEFTDESADLLNSFSNEQFDLANDNLHDELIPLDRNAVKVIEKIAVVMHMLDLNKTEPIEAKYVNRAIQVFRESRKTVYELFRHTPEFEKIYTYISMSKKPRTQSDIIADLGLTITSYKQNIDFVQEIAFKNNKKLVVRGDKLKEFTVEDYKTNDLKKIIVSTAEGNAAKKQFEINFRPMEIPLFDGDLAIEKLVTSSVPSFCLAHFEPSEKAPLGHRHLDRFIQGQNMVGFDFDGGISIDEIRDRLAPYVYLIYTTKSHNIEKNGVVDERFRVLMPTLTEFYVTPEEHKTLYENIADFLDFPIYDKATRNVSRLWYTNPEAEIYKNEEGGLLDVRLLIDRTKDREQFIAKDIELDKDELGARVYGMVQFTRANAVPGNRNNVMFNLLKFLMDMNYHDIPGLMYETNASIHQPLPESEIRAMLRAQRIES